MQLLISLNKPISLLYHHYNTIYLPITSKVWIKEYDPELWNVCAMTSGGHRVPDELVNRTNNALERYNRELNKAFPTAHPSMMDFVSVIRSESLRTLEQYENVKSGRQKKPVHAPVTLWTIPAAYHTFV
jgi:hypothetical protein